MLSVVIVCLLVKMCMDPTVASECKDRPPPLYLCTDCASQLNSRRLVDILQPVVDVSLTCENKVSTSLITVVCIVIVIIIIITRSLAIA